MIVDARETVVALLDLAAVDFPDEGVIVALVAAVGLTDFAFVGVTVALVAAVGVVDFAAVGVIVALVGEAAYEAGRLVAVAVVSLGTRVARDVASAADAAIDARRLARGCCCCWSFCGWIVDLRAAVPRTVRPGSC